MIIFMTGIGFLNIPPGGEIPEYENINQLSIHYSIICTVKSILLVQCMNPRKLPKQVTQIKNLPVFYSL